MSHFQFQFKSRKSYHFWNIFEPTSKGVSKLYCRHGISNIPWPKNKYFFHYQSLCWVSANPGDMTWRGFWIGRGSTPSFASALTARSSRESTRQEGEMLIIVVHTMSPSVQYTVYAEQKQENVGKSPLLLWHHVWLNFIICPAIVKNLNTSTA